MYNILVSLHCILFSHKITILNEVVTMNKKKIIFKFIMYMFLHYICKINRQLKQLFVTTMLYITQKFFREFNHSICHCLIHPWSLLFPMP